MNTNAPEDVIIVLAHDSRIHLHSGTLTRNSAFFASQLTEANAIKLSKQARDANIYHRWMLELRTMPTDEDPAGILERVKLNTSGDRLDGRLGPVWNLNGLPTPKIFEQYKTILYAFYTSTVEISSKTMEGALDDSVGLIYIAEYLGCVPMVAKPVEVALVRHGQALYRAIAKMPVAWLNMASRIKSELIFKEAMVHLAGNWRVLKTSSSKLEPQTRELVLKHHRELGRRSRKLELMLMSNYPGGICAPVEHRPIKCEEYAREILVWIALGWFRHWFGQQIINEKGYHGLDGGYGLYKQIHAAGDAYMDRSIINQFNEKFPMTKKAINVLENHLLEIKEAFKGIVSQTGIMENELHLDTGQYEVRYLTCARFDHAELPWLKEQVPLEPPVGGQKRGRIPGGNEIIRHTLDAARRLQDQNQMQLDEEIVDGEDGDEFCKVRQRTE
ncbi:hypothetical protein BS50DRAFT_656304 [Corynespora cassiicola Philippines]|uniref:BTB domain-containing protein n=1 Tax=Corynespora cassiicola Philippines TaxID=1448308 RepID=A0A2T2N3Q4_CORCC|nr:hypothetical protein BS50DRAFT_656304 [Corynespora cassiicola Philippines]